MEKRLVFHWFITNKKLNGNFSNTNKRHISDVEKFEKLHLNCLKAYSKIFTSATFIISREEGVTDDEIIDLQKKIIDCGFLTTRFVVVDNDSIYGECYTWKKYVIENEENFSGLTFYGQTKGITHEFSNSMTDWAIALYYFNLEYANNVFFNLTNPESKCISSGIFLIRGNDDPHSEYEVDYHHIYSGNMYWLNQDRLSLWYKENGKSPEDYQIKNRWSAEAYFSHTLPPEYVNSIGGVLDKCDDYKDCISHIFSTVNPEAIKGFLDFKYNVALKGITL